MVEKGFTNDPNVYGTFFGNVTGNVTGNADTASKIACVEGTFTPVISFTVVSGTALTQSAQVGRYYYITDSSNDKLVTLQLTLQIDTVGTTTFPAYIDLGAAPVPKYDVVAPVFASTVTARNNLRGYITAADTKITIPDKNGWGPLPNNIVFVNFSYIA